MEGDEASPKQEAAMRDRNTLVYSGKNLSGESDVIDIALKRGIRIMIVETKNSSIPKRYREYVVPAREALEYLGIALTPEMYGNPANATQRIFGFKEYQDNNNRLEQDLNQEFYQRRAAEVETARVKSYVFLGRIHAIFGADSVVDYAELKSVQMVSFSLMNVASVSFDKLARLSDLLGTRKINLSENGVVNEGCDTCRNGHTTVQPIHCAEVKFPND
jgi:hypothetical protein